MWNSDFLWISTHRYKSEHSRQLEVDFLVMKLHHHCERGANNGQTIQPRKDHVRTLSPLCYMAAMAVDAVNGVRRIVATLLSHLTEHQSLTPGRASRHNAGEYRQRWRILDRLTTLICQQGHCDLCRRKTHKSTVFFRCASP